MWSVTTKRKNEMKNELTQRIEQMRREAAQMGTPEMLVLFADVQIALDTQADEIVALRRAGERMLDAVEQAHIIGGQSAVDAVSAALRQAIAQAVQPTDQISQYGSKEMQAMILAQAGQPTKGN